VCLGTITDRYKGGLHSDTIMSFYIVITVKLCVVSRRNHGSILLFSLKGKAEESCFDSSVFLKVKTGESWLDSSVFLKVGDGGIIARFVCFS